MPENGRRPSQADVARRAGVSRGTVSMVLNNRTKGRVPISEETRIRVQQAAAELGYAPNPVGTMLAQGSNYLVGVFVYRHEFPYETDDFFFPYLTGIQREASVQEYNVLLFTRRQNSESGVYNNSMNSLLLADGSVLLGDNTNRQELGRLQSEGYPFVYIGRREVPGCQINWVIHDYRIGSAQAARHLIELGHRRLAFISTHPMHEPQEDKLAGCREALAHHPDAELVLYDINQFDPADRLVGELFANGITAVVCDAQMIFARVLHLLHAAHVRIPDDVSVLSLTTAHNSLPYALRPSYVLLDQQQVGAVATRILVERIRREIHEPQQILIPCRYVSGDTTGVPRR